MVLPLFILVGSCRSSKEFVEIERPVFVRDTIFTSRQLIDSVFIKDSVYADAGYIYREKVLYRNRYLTDTIYVTKTDTISLVRWKTKEVERKTSLLEKIFLSTGKVATIAILAWLTLLFFKRRL